ncbi:SWIM zinc finger family protein [Pelovirga terrestris]|uniref:SWIM zinc finger domain-containing protein n=1 Tax=Pelovirga terrestris TaxID=2771352 RepID=A0A8J6QW55_9BACT|nr:SWIM zinc finger family protein [Pelovirga terrestris]MBD1399561.1 SWIM zinc finger domain-containing protein [Pelovirga terrestris]
MEKIINSLKNLTLEDLREWAGSKIYNRGKEYIAGVSQLSRLEDGTLVAWVSGTDEYATWVRHVKDGEFDHDCTCPYDDYGPCKHSVAVLLSASQLLTRGQNIPLLDRDDELYQEAFDAEAGGWLAKENADDEVAEPCGLKKGRSSQLESMLAEKSHQELLALLVDLALDVPDVSRRLHDIMRLERGNVDQVVRTLRREIRRLTAEEVWFNHWRDEGNLPDYSHVEEQLEALLAKGYADAVLELGEELWNRGIVQVEEAHDEGETALAISSCLAVVLRALPATSLGPADQLLWRIDHELKDEYGLLDGVGAIATDHNYNLDDWHQVSLTLREWLDHCDKAKPDRCSARYQRTRIVNWLKTAYQCGGEPEKIIPLLEQEADLCRNYDVLIKFLLDAGQHQSARHWCIHGFKQTIADAPGIAASLQKELRLLAEKEQRYDLAAAYLAEDFFDQSYESTYLDLRQMAERIGAWSAVRTAILDYLNTGVSPSSDKGQLNWPLPEPEVKKPPAVNTIKYKRFPDWETLIDIAILEHRHNDAVSIYQEMIKVQGRGRLIDGKLAQAVAESHPDTALQIWLSISKGLIAEVKPKAYEEAAKYLRRMHQVYQRTDRLSEWTSLLQRLRIEHKAKRRLMQVLDGLEKNRKLVGPQMEIF